MFSHYWFDGIVVQIDRHGGANYYNNWWVYGGYIELYS